MMAQPNVIVLAVDALRADHLGCYGYRWPTSPNIDALAAEGVLAEGLYCPGIPTFPSFTTFYTGQHPLTHGIVGHGGNAQLARDAPHLAVSFLQAGYTTCALDNLMRKRLWMGRGYEFYIEPGMRRTLSLKTPSEELNARAIPWLRNHRDEPFFLFVHYWDPHSPYLPPAEYRSLFYAGGDPTDPGNRSLDGMWSHPYGAIARDTWLRTSQGVVTDANYVTALYDREVRHVDDGIGQVIAAVDELGLSERTLVVVTADHGESMTEHGIFFDHFGLYDCTIRVPLIARWPGRLPAGARLTHMLHVSDLAPTLVEAVGQPIPASVEGKSAWAMLEGREHAALHDGVISVEASWQAKWSLRTDRHKLILAREPDLLGNPPRELYDLTLDPQETHNIATTQPDLAANLEYELESWIARRLEELGKEEDPLITVGATMRTTWELH